MIFKYKPYDNPLYTQLIIKEIADCEKVINKTAKISSQNFAIIWL